MVSSFKNTGFHETRLLDYMVSSFKNTGFHETRLLDYMVSRFLGYKDSIIKVSRINSF